MRCFFCLEEKDPSVEHVFPDAIGGTLITDRVCTSCNSFLGTEVDARLTDHPFILIKRQQFGMTTSAGKPVNAFQKLFFEGTLASDPEKRIQLWYDPATGAVTPKMMYHARRTHQEDGASRVEITLDASDIERVRTIVQRERQRAGMDPMPESEIETLFAAIRQNIHTLEQPEVAYRLELDIFHYKRAVCKIVYELACMWLGDSYLDDPFAEMFRNSILKGKLEKIPGRIELSGDVPPLTLWRAAPNAHIALAHQQGVNIAIGVRVFDSISGALMVTNDARKYPSLKDGRFVLIGLSGGGSRSRTLVEEIICLSQSTRGIVA
jgi:HNH endonuclease